MAIGDRSLVASESATFPLNLWREERSAANLSRVRNSCEGRNPLFPLGLTAVTIPALATGRWKFHPVRLLRLSSCPMLCRISAMRSSAGFAMPRKCSIRSVR